MIVFICRRWIWDTPTHPNPSELNDCNTLVIPKPCQMNSYTSSSCSHSQLRAFLQCCNHALDWVRHPFCIAPSSCVIYKCIPISWWLNGIFGILEIHLGVFVLYYAEQEESNTQWKQNQGWRPTALSSVCQWSIFSPWVGALRDSIHCLDHVLHFLQGLWMCQSYRRCGGAPSLRAQTIARFTKMQS